MVKLRGDGNFIPSVYILKKGELMATSFVWFAGIENIDIALKLQPSSQDWKACLKNKEAFITDLKREKDKHNNLKEL